MKKFCYAYFNKLGDFYGLPFFTDHEGAEFQKVLRQTLFAAKQDDLEALKEDDLYLIGSFDNETGEFTPSKTFICSISGLSSEVLIKKYGVEENNGRA